MTETATVEEFRAAAFVRVWKVFGLAVPRPFTWETDLENELYVRAFSQYLLETGEIRTEKQREQARVIVGRMARFAFAELRRRHDEG